MTDAPNNPLFELQQTLYQSSNYTRRRLHLSRLAWVTRAIEKFGTNNAHSERAIEYGPGSGVYLPVLAKHFPAVVAADVENAYLNGIRPLLSRIGGLSLVADDILNSKLEKECFDLALCSEVLEHVQNPGKAVETLYQILKPGGVAVVTTPQRYSLLELCCKVAFLPGIIQLVRKIYREPVLETGHISLKTSGEFRKIVVENGFEILEEEKFGLYLPVVAEFGGAAGGRLIEAIEHKLNNTVFDALFWTQAYVLRRPLG